MSPARFIAAYSLVCLAAALLVARLGRARWSRAVSGTDVGRSNAETSLQWASAASALGALALAARSRLEAGFWSLLVMSALAELVRGWRVRRGRSDPRDQDTSAVRV